MAIGAGHLLEDRVPAFGRDARDGGEAAGESALSAHPRFGEGEGRVLRLPAGVDLVVGTLGRGDQASPIEPGFKSVSRVVDPAGKVCVNVLRFPRRRLGIMERASRPGLERDDEGYPLLAVLAGLDAAARGLE